MKTVFSFKLMNSVDRGRSPLLSLQCNTQFRKFRLFRFIINIHFFKDIYISKI